MAAAFRCDRKLRYTDALGDPYREIDQLIARPLELNALGRLRQFNQAAGRLHRDFDIPYTVLHGKYIDRELQGLTGAKDSGEGA